MASRRVGIGKPKNEVQQNEKPKEQTLKVALGDPVNEAVIIAAVVLDEAKRSKYLQSITADYFYAPNNALIWTSLQELFRRKLEYTPEALRQIAGAELDLDYLSTLLEARAEAIGNVQFHVGQLQWDRARVEMARGPLAAFLEAVRNPLTTPDRLRGLWKACGDSLSGFGSQQYLRDGYQLAREQNAKLTRLRGGLAVYPFGIDALDFYSEGEERPAGTPRLVPNAAPGQITVVTGVSGSAKSTSTAYATLMRALKYGRSSCYGAWELESGMTLQILAGMALDPPMNREDVMLGNFDEKDQRELFEKMEELAPLIRFFELPFGRARGERYYNDKALDLIHQVISDSGSEVFIADLARRAMKETKPDDEEQFLYRLQAIAQETKVHMILVQQQKSKEVALTRTKMPRSDLIMGSSAGWVGVADQIIGWHIPSLWKDVPNDKAVALVLKGRYMRKWPLAIELDYFPHVGHFGAGREITFEREEDDSIGASLENEFIEGGDTFAKSKRKNSRRRS